MDVIISGYQHPLVQTANQVFLICSCIIIIIITLSSS